MSSCCKFLMAKKTLKVDNCMSCVCRCESESNPCHNALAQYRIIVIVPKVLIKTPNACKDLSCVAISAACRPWSVFAFYTMVGNNTFPLPV